MGPRVKTAVQKRFCDIDPFRHVNNTAQYAYLDLGKTDLFARLGVGSVARGTSAVTVSAHTDFMVQIRYEDEITVESEVESVGHKSITLMQRIVRSDGVECTRCRAVMVAFDMAAQSSVEVPETWREALRGDDGPEPEDKA